MIDTGWYGINKKPRSAPGLLFFASCETFLEVHATHAAAHATAWHGRSGFLLRSLGDHGFGGDQQASHRRCILQSRAHDLGWVDDTGLNQVLELLGLSVEAKGVRRSVIVDLANDRRSLNTGVLGDLADRSLKGTQHDVDAGLH